MTSALEGMHGIGYCRVSTDPEDKGQTVETQKREINDWASKYGVIIDNIYADEGISGGTFPRPMLSMAIMSLVTTGASFIVARDQSRITRNAPEHLPQINKLLNGKVIRYTTEGDTDPNSVYSEVTSAIRGVMDKEERLKLKANTIKGMSTRREEGKHIGRPSKVVITDDPDKLPRGQIQARDGTLTDKMRVPRGTVVYSKEQALNWARLGWSANYTAHNVLRMSTSSFIAMMKKAGIYEEYKQILTEVKA